MHDIGVLDPPVRGNEPGINIALLAYAQGCHGVALGYGSTFGLSRSGTMSRTRTVCGWMATWPISGRS